MRIDPESLTAASARLAGLAGQMADEAAALEAAVTGSGNPWGGDETGTLFSGLYTAVLGNALQALGSYIEQVGYAAGGLSMQAKSVVESDTTAAGRVQDAGAGLGS